MHYAFDGKIRLIQTWVNGSWNLHYVIIFSLTIYIWSLQILKFVSFIFYLIFQPCFTPLLSPTITSRNNYKTNKHRRWNTNTECFQQRVWALASTCYLFIHISLLKSIVWTLCASTCRGKSLARKIIEGFIIIVQSNRLYQKKLLTVFSN